MIILVVLIDMRKIKRKIKGGTYINIYTKYLYLHIYTIIYNKNIKIYIYNIYNNVIDRK